MPLVQYILFKLTIFTQTFGVSQKVIRRSDIVKVYIMAMKSLLNFLVHNCTVYHCIKVDPHLSGLHLSGSSDYPDTKFFQG